MKLFEEFKLYENLFDSAEALNESNMSDMVRSIKAEIAQLEADKAADADPYSTVYYDEQIEACKAELAQLAYLAPDKVAARKAAAEKEAVADEIQSRLRQAFRALFSYFGNPKCIPLKGDGFVIAFRPLDDVIRAEAENICIKAGIPVKYNAERSGKKSVFDIDMEKLDLATPLSFTNPKIIKAKLAELTKEKPAEASVNDINVDEPAIEKSLTESYRRIISRGPALENNELFVDFD
jgi:hypothetical protein